MAHAAGVGRNEACGCLLHNTHGVIPSPLCLFESIQKLLERTRARRENLQKKIGDRPNSANRAMAKRPLADTNSVSSQPVIDKGMVTSAVGPVSLTSIQQTACLQRGSHSPPPSSTGLQTISLQAQVLGGERSVHSGRGEPGAHGGTACDGHTNCPSYRQKASGVP